MQDYVAEQLRLYRGRWQDDLVDIMKCAFYNVDNLAYMGAHVHREVSEEGQQNLETRLDFGLLFFDMQGIIDIGMCDMYPPASVGSLS